MFELGRHLLYISIDSPLWERQVAILSYVSLFYWQVCCNRPAFKVKKKWFLSESGICLDSSNCLLLYTSKYRNTKTHWFYRFKGAVIDIQTVHACPQIFHILFHVVFSPLKYPLYRSLFKAIDQFKQKFRQYVHWCNIVAVRL